MKYVFFCLLCFAGGAAAQADDIMYMHLKPDVQARSYAIFFIDPIAKSKTLIKHVELLGNLPVKEKHFDYDGKPFATVTNIYKGTLLQASAIKYNTKQPPYKTTYTYDAHSSKLVSEVAYEGRKKVRHDIYAYKGDSVIKQSFYDNGYYADKGKEIISHNSKGLIQSVQYLDTLDSVQSLLMNVYDTAFKLLQTTDSSANFVSKKTYAYDSLHRVVLTTSYYNGQKARVQKTFYDSFCKMDRYYSVFEEELLYIGNEFNQYNDKGRLIYSEYSNLFDTKEYDPDREPKAFRKRFFYDSQGLKRIEVHKEGKLAEVYEIKYHE